MFEIVVKLEYTSIHHVLYIIIIISITRIIRLDYSFIIIGIIIQSSTTIVAVLVVLIQCSEGGKFYESLV